MSKTTTQKLRGSRAKFPPKQYATSVVTSESQIPQGYTRLTQLANGSKQDLQDLSQAARMGCVPGIKVMRTVGDINSGPLFIEHAKAEAYLAEKRRLRNPDPDPAPAPQNGLPELANQAWIIQLLERILEEQTATRKLLERQCEAWGVDKQPTQQPESQIEGR